MDLKDWFQKKIKLPQTKEEDEMTTSSPSKIDFKKKNSKDVLSEESKKSSDENILETGKFQSPSKEEGIAGVEEELSMDQQHQQQQPSSFEEMKMQQQDVELKSVETEQSQSLQSMREGQQSSLAPSSSSSLPRQSSDAIPKYKMILVPHDGSEISDKALNHAIYLSKVSDAEIIILNVLDRIGSKDSSAVLATMKRGEGEHNKANKDLEITMEGGVKQMIEEKMKLCKEAGVKSKVSYKIQTGKPLDEIVKLSEEMNIDLVVMASSRIISSIRVLGSTTRKVISTIKKPVLVIHE